MFVFLRFEIRIFQTTSDREMTKTKVTDLEEFTTFSYQITYPAKITFGFLTFEIWNFQTTLDAEIINIKVIDLDDIYNFTLENLFIWYCHTQF